MFTAGLYYPDQLLLLRYDNGGYPCFVIKETSWAVFDAVMLDNAKAHLTHDVVSKITQRLMCSINFSPVAPLKPEGLLNVSLALLMKTGIIGFHQLPAATPGMPGERGLKEMP